MASRKPEAAAGGCFALWFVFCALLGLGLTGVGVWAVIKLVTHFAG